jgi:hypothetical protein
VLFNGEGEVAFTHACPCPFEILLPDNNWTGMSWSVLEFSLDFNYLLHTGIGLRLT